MKTLDRYIIRNFLATVGLAFVAVMGLRVVADLLFNIDDFGQISDVFVYYSYRSLTYFRELGGIIIVAGAAFSVARMNHTNELTAILASGVSLRRVLLPVLVCAIGLNLLLVLDTEFLIPACKQELSVSRGDVRGSDPFQVRLVADGQNSCWYSKSFTPKEWKLDSPLAVLRDAKFAYAGHVAGPEAQYDAKSRTWVLLPKRTIQTKSGEETEVSRLHVPGWSGAMTADFIPTRMGAGGAVYGDLRVNTIIRHYLMDRTDLSKEDWWRQFQRDPLRPAGMFDVDVSDKETGLAIRGKHLVFGQEAGTTDSGSPIPAKVTVLEDAVFEYSVPGGGGAKVRVAAPRAEFVPAQGIPELGVKGEGIHGWRVRDGRMEVVSDLNPTELSLRQSSDWLQYMSTEELTQLLRLEHVADRKTAVLVRHTRFADLFNNIIMLLVATPFILSRERNIKASAGLTVLMAGTFFVFIYFSRYIGLDPVLAAWLPILAFGPVAAVMIESIKT